MTVGILALQGDFREHEEILRSIGAPTLLVRQPKQLEHVDRLIIPGGESTTIGKLMALYHLLAPIRQRAGQTLTLWGTCAGAILMSRQLVGKHASDQPALAVMDITVRRNAFGRQLDSFETMVQMPVIGAQPIAGVFIRAPIIEAAGDGVEVLARIDDDTIVAARQGRLLVTTFHPELSGDDRVHRYFLEL